MWRFVRFWLRVTRSDDNEKALGFVRQIPGLDQFRGVQTSMIAEEGRLLCEADDMQGLLHGTAHILGMPPAFYRAFRQLVDYPQHAIPQHAQLTYFETLLARDVAQEMTRQAEFELFLDIQERTGLQPHEWPMLSQLAQSFVSALIPDNPTLRRAITIAQFDRLIEQALSACDTAVALRALTQKAKLAGVMQPGEDSTIDAMQDIIREIGTKTSPDPSSRTKKRIQARLIASENGHLAGTPETNGTQQRTA